jgi:hypothetical protein
MNELVAPETACPASDISKFLGSLSGQEQKGNTRGNWYQGKFHRRLTGLLPRSLLSVLRMQNRTAWAHLIPQGYVPLATTSIDVAAAAPFIESMGLVLPDLATLDAAPMMLESGDVANSDTSDFSGSDSGSGSGTGAGISPDTLADMLCLLAISPRPDDYASDGSNSSLGSGGGSGTDDELNQVNHAALGKPDDACGDVTYVISFLGDVHESSVSYNSEATVETLLNYIGARVDSLGEERNWGQIGVLYHDESCGASLNTVLQCVQLEITDSLVSYQMLVRQTVDEKIRDLRIKAVVTPADMEDFNSTVAQRYPAHSDEEAPDERRMELLALDSKYALRKRYRDLESEIDQDRSKLETRMADLAAVASLMQDADVTPPRPMARRQGVQAAPSVMAALDFDDDADPRAQQSHDGAQEHPLVFVFESADEAESDIESDSDEQEPSAGDESIDEQSTDGSDADSRRQPIAGDRPLDPMQVPIVLSSDDDDGTESISSTDSSGSDTEASQATASRQGRGCGGAVSARESNLCAWIRSFATDALSCFSSVSRQPEQSSKSIAFRGSGNGSKDIRDLLPDRWSPGDTGIHRNTTFPGERRQRAAHDEWLERVNQEKKEERAQRAENEQPCVLAPAALAVDHPSKHPPSDAEEGADPKSGSSEPGSGVGSGPGLRRSKRVEIQSAVTNVTSSSMVERVLSSHLHGQCYWRSTPD